MAFIPSAQTLKIELPNTDVVLLDVNISDTVTDVINRLAETHGLDAENLSLQKQNFTLFKLSEPVCVQVIDDKDCTLHLLQIKVSLFHVFLFMIHKT